VAVDSRYPLLEGLKRSAPQTADGAGLDPEEPLPFLIAGRQDLSNSPSSIASVTFPGQAVNKHQI
jgi:hypothetical protein